MDNFLKKANNRNSLKVLTKDFYIDELEKLANNINIIIEQRKERLVVFLSNEITKHFHKSTA
jgi:hypothetical protein